MPAARNGAVRFTDKQVEVVRLIAQGLTYQEIADHLGLHYRTGKHHADAVRHKLARLGHPVETAREVPRAFWLATGENPFPRSADELVR